MKTKIQDLKNLIKIAEQTKNQQEKLQYLKTARKILTIMRKEINKEIEAIEDQKNPFQHLGVDGRFVIPKGALKGS